MPRLGEGLQNYNAGTFGFSAERIEHLSATEYTLVTIVADKSGSVEPFQDDISNMIKEVVLACRKSARADNLMLRLITFNGSVAEEHGFKLLMNCNPDDYDRIIKAGGCTALYDATYSAVLSTIEYAKQLKSGYFMSNAILYILTDGVESGPHNGGSKMQANHIADMVSKAKSAEELDSITTILIGVNTTDVSVVQFLDQFKTGAGIDQFVNMGEATKQKLAKLAGFVSKSVVSSSQSLASGIPQPLPSLTF